MPKAMSDSSVTKIALGAAILISFLLLGLTAYERARVKSAIGHKQRELTAYKDVGLGALSGEKNKLEKQLKFLREADKDLSGMLFSKPSSRMTKEIGDPLKFKEELYKIRKKIKEDGAATDFRFPFWLGFDRYEHDIPGSADLPLRVKQLDIIKEIGNLALTSNIPELSNIEYLEAKKIFADTNKETLYTDFPVKVTLKCKNENLIGFMQKLSVADIPFRVDSFKIKVREEDGKATDELTAEFIIVAAVLPPEKT